MTKNKLQELVWDGEQYNEVTIRLTKGNCTEAGVLGAVLHSIVGWSGDQYQMFYDNATLLSGSDENPNSLYSINVFVLDKLLGTNYSERELDNVKECGQKMVDRMATAKRSIRETYKYAVVSITDGSDLIVLL